MRKQSKPSNILNTLKGSLEEFKSSFDWDNFIKGLDYFNNQLPSDLEKLITDLSNRGWFIYILEGDFIDLPSKVNGLIGKSSDEQDKFLENYIRLKADDFKRQLIETYPNRVNQIKDAFDTHDTGKYYSSIPTFILLAEGIGRDLLPNKIGIFEKYSQKAKKIKSGIPKTDDLFDNFSFTDPLEEVIFAPFRIKTEITENTDKYITAEDKKIFNRHLILHGLSDNYGTEVNSLKAIALTYFVHEALSHYLEREKENKP